MPLIRSGGGQTPQAQDDARAALRSDDPDARWRAARLLADSPAAIDALDAAVAVEADPRVREVIFTSLARLGAVDAVLPHLRSDDANLRTGALDALRAMIDAVRPHLPALLADSDSDVRILCCELARALPAQEATSLLIPVLDRDAEQNVCAAAVEVLTEVGVPAAIVPLQRCAQRFAGNGFLTFAVQVAVDRIKMQQDAADE